MEFQQAILSFLPEGSVSDGCSLPCHNPIFMLDTLSTKTAKEWRRDHMYNWALALPYEKIFNTVSHIFDSVYTYRHDALTRSL